MLTPIVWKNSSVEEQQAYFQRPVQKNNVDQLAQVQEIIRQVRKAGDQALLDLTYRYDGVALTQLQVSAAEISAAQQKVSSATVNAMQRVIQQLTAFHQIQKPTDVQVETSPGIVCESRVQPIQRVGLYIPGGSAPLVSTVLMLGVPAKIAGNPTRILCTPPDKSGCVHPAILVAAKLVGIEKIYAVGGAQAIAAMAYGTASIPKVDKIFGPGNRWVTQAKIAVAQDAAGAIYDLPAGPSEVMVVADDDANPEFVAADLLAQAEHGVDSQVMLICSSVGVANAVNHAVTQQLPLLSRATIASQALKNSYVFIVDDMQVAMSIVNSYAPEHLILQVKSPRQYLDAIESAGSIFLGGWSPESAGDYASGTNHVLPTQGYAKSVSGLSVGDFMKRISVQELTRSGLQDIAETICELTTIEGLDAHQRAVDIRLAEGNWHE